MSRDTLVVEALRDVRTTIQGLERQLTSATGTLARWLYLISAFTSTRRSPQAWAALIGIEIIEPDGWHQDDKQLDIPISFSEFFLRTTNSTIRILTDQRGVFVYTDVDPTAYDFFVDEGVTTDSPAV